MPGPQSSLEGPSRSAPASARRARSRCSGASRNAQYTAQMTTVPAAPPTIMSAVIDALKPLGITGIDMPATPERVWAAIQAARHRNAAM